MALPTEKGQVVNDEFEHRHMREHLSRIDTSLEKMDSSIEKMAESVNKFALNVAQSEILHKQYEMANRDIRVEMMAIAARVTLVEKYQTRCEERSKPMSWFADKAGTVIVTGVITSAMALFLIK